MRFVGNLGNEAPHSAKMTRGSSEHRSLDEIREEDFSLSPGQEALWLLYQLSPESAAAYNQVWALRVHMQLDLVATRRVAAALVERHAALRTTFHVSSGKPLQRLHQSLDVDFSVTDASTWSPPRLEERLHQEAGRLFDLEKGPLFRIAVLSCSQAEHVLLMGTHHVYSDFASAETLVREFWTLYSQEVGWRASSLAPLTKSFSDYILWQKEIVAGEEDERLWDFWRQQLSDELPVLELMGDRPRKAVRTYSGARVSKQLDRQLSAAVKSLARSHRASLYTTLLAAFQVLLHRYTGARDLLVGSPTAVIGAEAFTHLVGYRVNPVVLRAKFVDDLTFAAFLERTRHAVRGALKNRNFPFPRLVERLQPVREPGRSPLFQVMFAFQKAQGDDEWVELLNALAVQQSGVQVKLPGGYVETTSLAMKVALFDLTLAMAVTEGRLIVAFTYDTELFDPTTISRMARHFTRLLTEIVQRPHQRVSELPLLEDTQRHQLLVEFNDTVAAGGAPPRPEHENVIRWFEEQSAATPDATAVIGPCGRELSFRELNARANRLCRFISRRGGRRGALVGVCVERSLDMVVAVLGIMKSGAACLPLDPTYPPARLAFILEETRAPVLLTQRGVGKIVQNETTVIYLDGEWPQIALERSSNPPAEKLTALDLAYVTYTSGSTGQPKGIALSHLMLSNLIAWHLEEWPTGAGLLGGARTLQFASLSFDVSFYEMFITWCSGGAMVLVPEDSRRDISALAHFLRATKTEKVILPVVVLQRLAEECLALDFDPGLKEVTTTGEQLLITPAIARFFQRFAPMSLHNHYGPSETHVVTAYTLPPGSRSWGTHPPIGRPIAQTTVYLLSRRGLEPVPCGVVGELCVGGVSLARGYLGRSAQTAEKLIPDPFAPQPGGRLYRTGDRACYRRDGRLEFLGRLDHQVKVRGFRVELGEIEALLRRHPAIAEAAVLVHGDGSGGSRLVAYVAVDDLQPSTVDGRSLRAFLQQRLPDYMIPTGFVHCEALPLTPNGKVDRRALSKLDKSRGELARTSVAPRSMTERTVAEIWETMLGCTQIGIDDNFFELGGHSLVAAQAAARIGRFLEVELPFKDFFEFPSVARLARRIDALREERMALRRPPVERAPRDQPLPLSFGQQRFWFLDQIGHQDVQYNLPLAIGLKGRLDVGSLNRALAEIVQRHEILRTVFAPIDGQPAQVVSGHVPSSIFHLLDLREIPDDFRETEVRRIISEQTRQYFDLSLGPLLRPLLLELDSEQYVILVTMHHAITDGGSIEIFCRELLSLYESFSAGRPSPLAELPVQYADYAYWQRLSLTDEVLRTQLEYWRRQLAGAPDTLQLPGDRPRPEIQTYRGAAHPLKIDRGLTDDIKALGLTHGASLFMSLTAVFMTLLYRISEQRDIVVGSPIANRPREELEGLIGFFVNNLVLRSEISSDLSFADLLKRVRATALGAYAHQDVPFENIVGEMRPQRDLSRTPLFQVVLVLQDVSPFQATLPELVWERLDLEYNTVRFDLELHLWERAGGLNGLAVYNPDLFDTTTVARWAKSFPRLAAAAVEKPDCRLGWLCFLSPPERHQLVVEWNVDAGLGGEGTIPALFESQARNRGDALALVCGDQRLTYSDLNRRANQLAHHLKRLGVGPESRVAVAVEASPELVVGLLGTLKAGAAVLPLDLTSPPSRLELMLRDSQACALILQGAGTDLLGASSGQWQSVDVGAPEIALNSDDDPPGEVGAQHLAYLIYTSGTTGRPKAVAITHGQVLPILLWGCRYFGLGEGTRVLQTLSPGFDFGLFEILTTLLCGGALHFLRSAERPDVSCYTAYIAEHAIDTVHSTPCFFREIVNQDRQLPSLENVHLGGERLPRALVRRIAAVTGEGCRVYNGYGPTETSVNCAIFRLQGRPLDRGIRGEEIPIGRVTARNAIYLLDRSGQPTPWSLPGELTVGGAGVARGYLNRPALTAEKLVPDPWSGRPGARLYRSGDLARYQADGQMVFLGRMDQQVKIRGTRIEPAEIEALLREHPAVAEAVVTVWEDGTGDPGLAAHVVPRAPGGEAEAAIPRLMPALQSYLRKRLPRAMQPTAWSLLAGLPRNASGKLDRKALPEPDATPPERAAPYVAPRNVLEKSLAAVWRQLLELEMIGIDDNFFDVGGHSLLLLRLHKALREEFGDGEVVDLFRYPTIRSLAARLRHVADPLPPSEPLRRAHERTVARQEVARQRQSRQRHRAKSSEESA